MKSSKLYCLFLMLFASQIIYANNLDVNDSVFYHSPDIQHILGCDGMPGVSVYNGNKYEVYYVNRGTSSVPAISTTNIERSDIITESSSLTNVQTADGWIYCRMTSSSTMTGSAVDEFEAPIRCFNLQNNDSLVLRVNGYSEFALYANDNDVNLSRGKYLDVIIDGVVQPLSLNRTPSVRRYSISSGKHHIKVVGNGGSSNRVYAFSLRPDSTLLIPYQVTYSSNNEAWGTVEPVLLDSCHPDSATLKAVPASAARFSQWNDGVTTNPRTWNLTKDTTIEAVFIQDSTKYALTLLSNDENIGSVIGAGTYYCNERITITAVPETGYCFVRWSDGSCMAQREIQIEENTELIAYFVKQKSTEGTRFWVALPYMVNTNAPEPFIAISANDSCQISISNPNTGWRTSFVMKGFFRYEDIPLAQWYDANATPVSVSGCALNQGLLIESTDTISVYVAAHVAWSYDVTNVLPEDALSSEYIIQDYPPYDNQDVAHSEIVIVACEDNTLVEITPTTQTLDGHLANIPYIITLHTGQVYRVLSAGNYMSLSGSRVRSLNNTEIAVFTADDFTRVPDARSARDCLFEQAMPLTMWGNQFVVTRSLEKDANRIRITASENNTHVSINGTEFCTLQSGETFEFEMSHNLATGDMLRHLTVVPPVVDCEAAYISTSAPCAVYSYDVSGSYKHSAETTSTFGNGFGDPAMVWVNPLNQGVQEITFAPLGTMLANRHFINIVSPTDGCESVVLYMIINDFKMPVYPEFTPVPGLPQYSYARLFLLDTELSLYTYFTLVAPQGVTAHVYGNGDDEGYSFSLGSHLKKTIKEDINVPTSVEKAKEELPLVRKVLIDNHLFIITNQGVYDLTGCVAR